MNGEYPDKQASVTKDQMSHAESWNGSGVTLCGLVEEGDPVIGLPPAKFASSGQRVNCQDCISAIHHVYAFYTINGKRR